MNHERPRPGWAAYIEETPAEAIVAMPPDLAKKVANYIAALALEAGGALDKGKQPPATRWTTATRASVSRSRASL
ncbi:hypothetical protein SAZ11_53750 [Streptomyces sp. FXJ1.4098]|nr:hypothetical protein [Streptomyces sp. FXJ1.4098]